MGTEIGAVLFGEQPRLYTGGGFGKVNFLLTRCDRG